MQPLYVDFDSMICCLAVCIIRRMQPLYIVVDISVICCPVLSSAPFAGRFICVVVDISEICCPVLRSAFAAKYLCRRRLYIDLLPWGPLHPRAAAKVIASAPAPPALPPHTLHSAATCPSAAAAECGRFSRRMPPEDAGRGADSGAGWSARVRWPVDLDVEHALAPVRQDAGDDNVRLEAPV
jgi:hypothetical protein